MRLAKYLSNTFPTGLIWSRLTFSKITTAFFIVALLHCVVQVGLEVFAFKTNNDALNLLQKIYTLGNSPQEGFAIFNNFNLTICKGVPDNKNCQVVWSADEVAAAVGTAPYASYASGLSSQTVPNAFSQATPATNHASVPLEDAEPLGAQVISVAASRPTPAPFVANAPSQPVAPKTVTIIEGPFAGEIFEGTRKRAAPLAKRTGLKVQYNSTGSLVGVLVTDPGLRGGQTLATPDCVMSLQVPIQSLRNTVREDVTFIGFQIWVFGMSLVALLNESIPHTLASLVTHLLATAWSGYQLINTEQFHRQFQILIIGGPCQTNLLPSYWSPRRDTDIAVASMNVLTLVISAVLSYKLIKAFGWQTFKRIGASFSINRIYRLVLGLSISIQLSVFFIGANVALWIDQLIHGNVASFTVGRHTLEGIYIAALVLLFPWLAVGWFAVRRENKVLMLAFLLLALVMITGFALMFASASFLWTFKSWDFFAVMTCMAAVLLASSLALGITCRLNFGQGLPRYLNPQQQTEEEFFPEDIKVPLGDDEKVEFPMGAPIPTFSVTFGRGTEVPPPSQMRFVPVRPAPGINMHSRQGSLTEDYPFAGYRGPVGPPPGLAAPQAAAYAQRRESASSIASSTTAPSDPYRGRNGSVDSGRTRTTNNSGRSNPARQYTGAERPAPSHERAPSNGSTSSKGSAPGGRRRWEIE